MSLMSPTFLDAFGVLGLFRNKGGTEKRSAVSTGRTPPGRTPRVWNVGTRNPAHLLPGLVQRFSEIFADPPLIPKQGSRYHRVWYVVYDASASASKSRNAELARVAPGCSKDTRTVRPLSELSPRISNFKFAEHAVSAGRYSSPDSRSPLSPSMQVSLWMQRWQHRLSTWLHVSLSQQLLRLYRPAGILYASL